MKAPERFEFGDRVRHDKRPEWGIGSVVKAEESTVNGSPMQRLSVRFPNAGIKTLSTQHAELSVVADEPGTSTITDDSPSIETLDRMNDGWLGSMAKRKVDEIMLAIPEPARDPFSSYRQRLQFTLALYRFDRSGRGLIDWAVAQSGLDDPLGRFTRQELEQMFDRWSMERDNHLRKLLDEGRTETNVVRELMASAPAPAQHAVQRIHARR